MPPGISPYPASLDDAGTLIHASNWPVFTTLRQTIGPTDATIPVESTDRYAPAPDIITIRNERISYTGVTPQSFTGCLRGQFQADGGSPATEHPGGTDVVQQYTSTHHRVLSDAIRNIEGVVGGGVVSKRYAMGAPAAGDTLTGFGVLGTPVDFASAPTLPANDLTVGRVYKVEGAGLYTINTSLPSIRFWLRLGTVTLAMDTIAFGATARTNRPWRMDFTVVVVTTGATGTVEVAGTGRLFTSANAETEFEFFNTTAITVDTTVAQRLGLSVGSGNAGTSVQQRQLVIVSS